MPNYNALNKITSLQRAVKCRRWGVSMIRIICWLYVRSFVPQPCNFSYLPKSKKWVEFRIQLQVSQQVFCSVVSGSLPWTLLTLYRGCCGLLQPPTKARCQKMPVAPHHSNSFKSAVCMFQACVLSLSFYESNKLPKLKKNKTLTHT